MSIEWWNKERQPLKSNEQHNYDKDPEQECSRSKIKSEKYLKITQVMPTSK